MRKLAHRRQVNHYDYPLKPALALNLSDSQIIGKLQCHLKVRPFKPQNINAGTLIIIIILIKMILKSSLIMINHDDQRSVVVLVLNPLLKLTPMPSREELDLPLLLNVSIKL